MPSQRQMLYLLGVPVALACVVYTFGTTGTGPPGQGSGHQEEDTHVSGPRMVGTTAANRPVGQGTWPVPPAHRPRGPRGNLEYVVLAGGQAGWRMPNGSVLFAAGEPATTDRADVLPAWRFLNDHPRLASQVQDDGVDGPGIDRCLDELHARSPIVSHTEWVLVVHVQGDGRTARVVDVEPEAAWPAEFDVEARACYLRKLFRKKEWESPLGGLVKFEYPLCVGPPAGGRAEREGEER